MELCPSNASSFSLTSPKGKMMIEFVYFFEINRVNSLSLTATIIYINCMNYNLLILLSDWGGHYMFEQIL